MKRSALPFGVALSWIVAALLAACSAAPPAPPLLRQARQLQEPAATDEAALDKLLAARRIYQATDRGDERGQTEVAIAAFYLRHDDVAAADAWARRAAGASDVSPATQANAWARAAQAALRGGRADAAAEAMDAAAAACPRCTREAGFLVLLGRVRLAQARPADALASATQALQAADADDARRADAQRLRGEASLAAGDAAVALAALAIAHASDHAAARADRIWLDLRLMAQALRSLGRDAEAGDADRRSAAALEASSALQPAGAASAAGAP